MTTKAYNQDLYFLKQTLALARRGMGWTNPNPMVGCVIVKNDRIISSGYHKKAGFDHAEINALNTAKNDTKNATLYVNLEPCSHYGRTPPCVNAIIKAGIARVVCPVIDTNPRVQGNGIKILQNAGVKVTTGLLQEEAIKLNEAYFSFHGRKRPFIVLKFAASLDGKIAARSGDSKWITNEKARIFARNLRGEYQSILVGINTILRDDPNLGTNKRGKKDPLRIILDSTLRIPIGSRVLRDNNVLIVTSEKANKSKKDVLLKKGIPLVSCGEERVSLGRLMNELAKREVISVFVEGGGNIHGSFVDGKLVDKVYAFHGPLIIGGKNTVTVVEGEGANTISDAIRLTSIIFRRFDDCSLTIGYPKFP